MKRTIAVLLVALGLACVSVALGLIYIDYSEREGRWVQLTMEANLNEPPPLFVSLDKELVSKMKTEDHELKAPSIQTDKKIKLSDEDMKLWFDHSRSYVAMGFGTFGVAFLGAGLMLAIFELRVFSRGTE